MLKVNINPPFRLLPNSSRLLLIVIDLKRLLSLCPKTLVYRRRLSCAVTLSSNSHYSLPEKSLSFESLLSDNPYPGSLVESFTLPVSLNFQSLFPLLTLKHSSRPLVQSVDSNSQSRLLSSRTLMQ